jgi:thiosulfate/3-mercaptopyruvate sulfurtransferase
MACSSSEGGEKEKEGPKKADTLSEKSENAEGKKGKPWSPDEVMPPQKLAKMLEDSTAELPMIHCVGPMAMIPHSEHFGEAHKDSAIQAYRKALEDLPKDSSLVFYCGCCPFEDCPNIRPAYRLLEDMGFEDYHLLGLRTSLKADWIDRDFPVRSTEGS